MISVLVVPTIHTNYDVPRPVTIYQAPHTWTSFYPPLQFHLLTTWIANQQQQHQQHQAIC